jgi:hypothetical protein
MALSKTNQIDLRGNELLISEVTASTPVATSAASVTVTPPVTDEGWTTVQAALADIAARLASAEI